MLEITNLIDEFTKESRVKQRVAVSLCLPLVFTKSAKQSKHCLVGGHYLSSFRELTKSVFLFQNFRELATVALFENYLVSVQVQSPIAEVCTPK